MSVRNHHYNYTYYFITSILISNYYYQREKHPHIVRTVPWNILRKFELAFFWREVILVSVLETGLSLYPVLHKPPGATITSRSAVRIRINFWRMVGLYISFGDWANALECRVVHGSLFLDPTRPAETLTRPDPRLPTKSLTRPDPRPDPTPICIVFNLIIIFIN